MPPPIKVPKRKLSIPSFGLGGKRSRTNSPSRAPDSGTSIPGVVHPQNVGQSTANSSSSLHGEEPELSVPNISTERSRDQTTLASQGMTPGPQVAPIGSTSNRDATDPTWIGLEKALAALHITTKICPPLHSAIEGLKSCLHIFEEAARSRKDYKELATGLTAMVGLLIRHMSVTASREIMETIENIAKKITEELESINKRQHHSGPSRMLRTSRDDEDLVRRYRRIEQLVRELQAEASMSTWDITKRHHVDTQLEKLGPVKLANYNSRISMDIGRRSCTENTRTKILSDAMEWAENPDGAKIYWMNGMAGTGKTTIAYSLCERLEGSEQLSASFFCTRASRECSEAKQIVPTIAYQLARRSAPFRDALCRILDKDPDIGSLNTTSQFDSLLAKPLIESRELMARNLVIVIDALDECNDPYAVNIVLDILFRYASELPVKFFVTSRPEPTIRNSMMAGIAEHNRSRSILYLHEIEKSLVKADIELYLRDELKCMLPIHHADIETLAEQAGKLFIYAATAVRYIRPTGKAVDPKRRLKTILGVNNKSKKSMSDIDVLYSAILSAAIDDSDLEIEDQVNIKTVLWTAICACEPVLIDTLAALCNLDKTDLVASALQPLRSVLHVSDHNNLVTTLHASFPDFMFSQERSKEFFCDRPSHDQFLARRCLEIMKSQLRFNICRIESSYIVDSNISDLEKRVEHNISEELFYASRFWVDHLNQGDSSPPIEMVHEFLSRRLLFWMEALNLKKCIMVGAAASTKAHMWLRNSRAPEEIVSLARDAQTFVWNYAVNISASTSHIYISALPLSSPTSRVRTIYRPRFTGLVQATGSLMNRIDQASLAVWKPDYPVRLASFSADRKYIVTGNDSGEISVRHPLSGEPFITFQAHREAVTSVLFSSDAMLMVSGSYDRTICIWKVSDGSLAFGPFRGHTGRVNSVAFSPDEMWLASGSDDSNIRIWATRGLCGCRSILAGHISAVRSVMFSPDGIQIVSGSNDRTICIWDALSGTLLRSLRGHAGPISCVRFSPCGTFIVSGSHDGTIRVWNTHSGIPISNPFQGHSDLITSVAVSPEGERVVSGSFDCTVLVWHIKSGEIMAGPFEGHTGSVRSVEFSADGARIVSASEDRTVRIWNSQGRAGSCSTNKSQHKTSNIRLVSISPTGTYIATGDQSRIAVWNIQNGSQTSDSILPSDITTKGLLLLTFSSTGASLFGMYEHGARWEIDMKTRSVVSRYSAPYWGDMSHPLTLSPDGRSVISCAKIYFYELALWNLAGRLICMINSHDGIDTFSEAVFSSNSSWLATRTTRGIVDLWNGRSGQHVAGPFHPDTRHQLRSMDVSPDGAHIVLVRSGETPRLYNTANGTCTILPGPICSGANETVCAKFSPNAEYISYSTQIRDQFGQRYVICLIPNVDDGRPGYQTSVIGDFCPNKATFGFIGNKPCVVSTPRDCDTEIIVRTGLDIDDYPYTLDEDGWMRNKHLQPLIWVPPEIRSGFPVTNELKIMEQGSIGVNFNGTMMGNEWNKCYIGE